jgi:hypothetical protein
MDAHRRNALRTLLEEELCALRRLVLEIRDDHEGLATPGGQTREAEAALRAHWQKRDRRLATLGRALIDWYDAGGEIHLDEPDQEETSFEAVARETLQGVLDEEMADEARAEASIEESDWQTQLLSLEAYMVDEAPTEAPTEAPAEAPTEAPTEVSVVPMIRAFPVTRRHRSPPRPAAEGEATRRGLAGRASGLRAGALVG